MISPFSLYKYPQYDSTCSQPEHLRPLAAGAFKVTRERLCYGFIQALQKVRGWYQIKHLQAHQ